MGANREHISTIENGHSDPTLSYLRRVQKALAEHNVFVSLDDLAREDEEAPGQESTLEVAPVRA